MEIPGVSIVLPVYNEQNNVINVTAEIIAAFHSIRYEIIFVDDASQDATHMQLCELAKIYHHIKILQHKQNQGQSQALITGVASAIYPWIATLDGDGQNDPADLIIFLKKLNEFISTGNDKVILVGSRIIRQDPFTKHYASLIANYVRQWLLKDNCADSGCGIKIFSRSAFLSLPLFKNCHRFLPALFHAMDFKIINIPVNHRPRTIGQSKYGIWNRAWVGIVDLWGVTWLLKRKIRKEWR